MPPTFDPERVTCEYRQGRVLVHLSAHGPLLASTLTLPCPDEPSDISHALSSLLTQFTPSAVHTLHCCDLYIAISGPLFSQLTYRWTYLQTLELVACVGLWPWYSLLGASAFPMLRQLTISACEVDISDLGACLYERHCVCKCERLDLLVLDAHLTGAIDPLDIPDLYPAAKSRKDIFSVTGLARAWTQINTAVTCLRFDNDTDSDTASFPDVFTEPNSDTLALEAYLQETPLPHSRPPSSFEEYEDWIAHCAHLQETPVPPARPPSPFENYEEWLAYCAE
ncbi:hypothetical protein CERSUDRAFT_94625 [Gelatoporia subvermispora B]|uniref:Uncharacterized protein n=1 Tax=Ceriporiopsis subvermispora (strain B) TaxID=914234 RepID=M2QKR7_CERS8|nr:hypothetical protein CERSUDRAFT_94625 [Gelatoporia subvermispora B]